MHYERFDDMEHLGFRRIANELPGQVQSRFAQSAVTSDDTFRITVEKLKPKIAVEIGTFCGVSTLVLADIAEHVHTFDVTERTSTYANWDLFKLRPKITYYICPQGREQIKNGLENINADFAFIDAVHDYPNVKADFELCKRFGRVLFHDAEFEGVKKFLHEIKAEFINKDFAYWEEKA